MTGSQHFNTSQWRNRSPVPHIFRQSASPPETTAQKYAITPTKFAISPRSARKSRKLDIYVYIASKRALHMVLSERTCPAKKFNLKKIEEVMNEQSIGECAGTVWRLLSGSNRKWKFDEIKEATGLSNRDLNAAIGWLAREGKLNFEEEGDSEESFYIALNYYIG